MINGFTLSLIYIDRRFLYIYFMLQIIFDKNVLTIVLIEGKVTICLCSCLPSCLPAWQLRLLYYCCLFRAKLLIHCSCLNGGFHLALLSLLRKKRRLILRNTEIAADSAQINAL